MLKQKKQKPNEWKPYRDKLTKDARTRYFEKLSTIDNIDPYELAANSWKTDASLLPPTSSIDITNYLVYGISASTFDEFRNYKSLEAHGHFSNGWVQDLYSYQPKDCANTVVTAKVLHSQRLSDAPLKPWAIIEPSGAVSSCHCTCMAGIAETCTHVAAMLFKLEAVVRCRETVTVTGQPAYWMIPSNITKVGAEAGHKIDFTTPKSKRKSLNRYLDGEGASIGDIRTSSKTCAFSISSEEQWASYLLEMQKVSPKAAVLSNMPHFCDAFEDPIQPFSAPQSLRCLRDEKLDGCELSVLQLHCKTLASKVEISHEQAHYIEEKTRQQHMCSTWHHFRAGRVTASNMHSVYVSDLNKPAQSTVKSVCYPNSPTVNQSAAAAWGIQNEENGRTQYRLQAEKHHCNFEMRQCGFIINPDFPMVGASPDGLVQCTCCGRGCVEIKCPYKYWDTTVEEACNSCDRNFCLKVLDGELQLKKDHPYNKQVQTQIFVTNAEYCDFVLWTVKDCVVLRVAPDPQLWSALLEKAQNFFECVCLPELVSRYFTQGAGKEPLHEVAAQDSNKIKTCLNANPEQSKCRRRKMSKKSWCLCGGTESDDDMVACDNQNCTVVWFHLSCVGLQYAPSEEENWQCSSCSAMVNVSGV